MFFFTRCFLNLSIQLFLILSGCWRIHMYVRNTFTNANSHRYNCISDKVGRSVSQKFFSVRYLWNPDGFLDKVGRSVGQTFFPNNIYWVRHAMLIKFMSFFQNISKRTFTFLPEPDQTCKRTWARNGDGTLETVWSFSWWKGVGLFAALVSNTFVKKFFTIVTLTSCVFYCVVS